MSVRVLGNPSGDQRVTVRCGRAGEAALFFADEPSGVGGVPSRTIENVRSTGAVRKRAVTDAGLRICICICMVNAFRNVFTMCIKRLDSQVVVLVVYFHERMDPFV